LPLKRKRSTKPQPIAARTERREKRKKEKRKIKKQS
jgi:hypothetical protein